MSIVVQEYPLSPSQIRGGVQCPHGWNFSKLRLPAMEMDRTYATVGDVFHRSIKEYYSVIGDKPHKGQIVGTFETILDRLWKAEGLDRIDKLKSRREKCTANFIKFEVKRARTWKQYIPTMIEEKVKATVNGINYVTIPDVYWEQEATIVDWKTGRMNALGEMEFIQGGVERMVLTALGLPVRKVIFVCLLVGLELEMPQVKDQYVEVRVKQLLQFTATGRYPKKRGPHCRYCPHQVRCQLQDRRICLWM